MKTKNKALMVWGLMLVVAISSSFSVTEAFEGVRNVDLLKLVTIGFLAGGFVSELIHQFKKG